MKSVKNKLISFVAKITILMMIQGVAHATPILLGTINAQAAGTSSGGISNLDPEGVVFAMGFKNSSTDPIFDCAGYIGCERVWGLGETGSFDFNVGNTVASTFMSIADKLTNGVDENTINPDEYLYRGAWTINTNSTMVFPGSMGGGPESFFNIPTGASIDFIRLIVSETTLSTTITTFQRTEYSYIGQFQIWGTVADIPEPRDLTLFLLGLALILLRKKP